MYIDYIINDVAITEVETKQNLEHILGPDYKTNLVNSITAPAFLIKSIKNFLKEKNLERDISLSCLIDYPMGISDIKTRQSSVIYAIGLGANCIDVVMPQNLAANRKYDKIREDIKQIKEVCENQDIKIRYILEYRIFDHHCLKKICEIFDDFGIKYCFPSTGFFLDNISDNIIASIFLYKNSKNINIISSGQFWNKDQFKTIIKSGIYGFRTNSPFVCKDFFSFISKNSGV
jgi:deoxyribose-phosphate aldolase